MTIKIRSMEYSKIIDLYNKGYKVKWIADKYGVTRNSVLNILNKNGIKLRLMGCDHKKYQPVKKYFNLIDDEYKAYFLGLLWADGCNVGSGIQIGLQEGDEYVLKEMSSRIFINHRPLYFANNEKHKFKNLFKLSIYDTEIVKLLESFGLIKNKSLTLQYPKDGVISDNLFRHFIRGYFDGDGWAFLKKDKHWNSLHLEWGIIGSEAFLISVKKNLEIALATKIDNKICRHSSVYRLRICKDVFINKIYRFLYDEANIYLLRKKEKFDEYFKTISP